MVSIISIVIVDILLLFLPAESYLPHMFGVLPFEKDGKSYYSYKAWVGLGILINSILTYLAETCIILGATRKADKRAAMKKRNDFITMMESQAAELRNKGVMVTLPPQSGKKSTNNTLEVLASNNYGVLR